MELRLSTPAVSGWRPLRQGVHHLRHRAAPGVRVPLPLYVEDLPLPGVVTEGYRQLGAPVGQPAHAGKQHRPLRTVQVPEVVVQRPRRRDVVEVQRGHEARFGLVLKQHGIDHGRGGVLAGHGRRGGGDPLGRAAREVAGEVHVVYAVVDDREVRDAQVLAVRLVLVLAVDVHNAVQVPQDSTVQQHLHGLVRRGPARLLVDHQRHARLRADLHDALRLGQRRRQRLL